MVLHIGPFSECSLDKRMDKLDKKISWDRTHEPCGSLPRGAADGKNT